MPPGNMLQPVSCNKQQILISSALVLFIVLPFLLLRHCSILYIISDANSSSSLQSLWLQYLVQMPAGLWSFISSYCSVGVNSFFAFTSTNLFILLNLLILTIVKLAHFHSTAAPAANYDSSPSTPAEGSAAADKPREHSDDDQLVIASAGHAGQSMLQQRPVANSSYNDHDLDALLHDRSVSGDDQRLDELNNVHILEDDVHNYIFEDWGDSSNGAPKYYTSTTDHTVPQYCVITGKSTSHERIKIKVEAGSYIIAGNDNIDQATPVSAGFKIMTEIRRSRERIPQLQPAAAAVDREQMQELIIYRSSSDALHEETGTSPGQVSEKSKLAAGAHAAQYDEYVDRLATAGSDRLDIIDDQLIDSILAKNGSIFKHDAEIDSGRPLASARFTPARTRKAAVSPTRITDRSLSPLRISKPLVKRGDTLDAIWKAICESKRHSNPGFNRHNSPKHNISAESSTHHHHHAHMRKPRESPSSSSSSLVSPIKQRRPRNIGRLVNTDHEFLTQNHCVRRREPSMAHEELNAKVESFISRFHAQIKIQREKSLLDFMEMVGRGSS